MSGLLAGKSSRGLARGRAEFYSFHPNPRGALGPSNFKAQVGWSQCKAGLTPHHKEGAQSNGTSLPSMPPRPSRTQVGGWPYSTFPGQDKHRSGLIWAYQPPQVFPQCLVLKRNVSRLFPCGVGCRCCLWLRRGPASSNNVWTKALTSRPQVMLNSAKNTWKALPRSVYLVPY